MCSHSSVLLNATLHLILQVFERNDCLGVLWRRCLRQRHDKTLIIRVMGILRRLVMQYPPAAQHEYVGEPMVDSMRNVT